MNPEFTRKFSQYVSLFGHRTYENMTSDIPESGITSSHLWLASKKTPI
ncbi:hypothetical protein [Shewanella maritima]|nr:hypothetical protein [Shewanella maritima]